MCEKAMRSLLGCCRRYCFPSALRGRGGTLLPPVISSVLRVLLPPFSLLRSASSLLVVLHHSYFSSQTLHVVGQPCNCNFSWSQGV